MTRMLTVLRALYQGAQLAKASTWKKVGVATAAMTAFLSSLAGIAASFGYLEGVSQQMVMEVSSALVAIISAVLAYLQVATDETMGLRDRRAESERLLHGTAKGGAQHDAGPDSSVSRDLWVNFSDDD